MPGPSDCTRHTLTCSQLWRSEAWAERKALVLGPVDRSWAPGRCGGGSQIFPSWGRLRPSSRKPALQQLTAGPLAWRPAGDFLSLLVAPSSSWAFISVIIWLSTISLLIKSKQTDRGPQFYPENPLRVCVYLPRLRPTDFYPAPTRLPLWTPFLHTGQDLRLRPSCPRLDVSGHRSLASLCHSHTCGSDAQPPCHALLGPRLTSAGLWPPRCAQCSPPPPPPHFSSCASLSAWSAVFRSSL